MKIELADISKLKPYKNNPRIADDDAVSAVAASLEQFGFRQPIVVDSKMTIIAGHTRFAAAKKLGLKKVPIHVAADMTPQQITAYRLADNRVAEQSTWDYSILPIELESLKNDGFSMASLGWDDAEVDRLIAAVDEVPEGADGTEFDESAGDSVPLIECPKCGHQFPK